MTADPVHRERSLRGIPVYPGIVIGKARLVDRSRVKIMYQYLMDNDRVHREAERFERAVRTVEKQLLAIKNGMPGKVKDHSFIFRQSSVDPQGQHALQIHHGSYPG
ncbi:MAG: phosphoenolpyruvate-utilizing N-terminal domain-containing protein [Deltaproteobacteria bacterium]|nr:phosphoenolpyruvate-utilizing N-terminal domain-containing protein [Deltaproteobacteria bacterium]